MAEIVFPISETIPKTDAVLHAFNGLTPQHLSDLMGISFYNGQMRILPGGHVLEFGYYVSDHLALNIRASLNTKSLGQSNTNWIEFNVVHRTTEGSWRGFRVDYNPASLEEFDRFVPRFFQVLPLDGEFYIPHDGHAIKLNHERYSRDVKRFPGYQAMTTFFVEPGLVVIKKHGVELPYKFVEQGLTLLS